MAIVASERGPVANYGHTPWLESPSKWRVCIADDDGEFWAVATPSLDCVFASERDAQIAATALRKAGVNSTGDCLRVGYRKCREIMCEALPW